MSDRMTEAEQEVVAERIAGLVTEINESEKPPYHLGQSPQLDGSMIERYVRTHAERNSKGINIDATVSIRVTMPLSIHPESARYLIKDELSGLQQIADDHLAARLAVLSQS